MSTATVSGKSRRRRLSPSEKYEIYVSVLTGQATQREAAERYRVDRSTVVTACRVAAVHASQFDHDALQELSGGHRREDHRAETAG